jgi:hypothetical protein
MGIFYMVADANGFLLHDDDFVEIVKNKKPAVKESAIPERIRDPRIEVGIVPWRRVISDHRWPITVIIAADR